jgi:hypothetical protein
MIDEMLGTLADLHRVEADDLIGKPIRHFIQHGAASLGVKIPSFDDRITPDKLFSQLGNLMLAVFNFGEQLSIFQRPDLWRIRQQVAGVVGKVSFPRIHIMRAIRQPLRCIGLALVTLNRTL